MKNINSAINSILAATCLIVLAICTGCSGLLPEGAVIRYSQIGYLPSATKVAVLYVPVNDSVSASQIRPNQSFSVIDANTHRRVFNGKIENQRMNFSFVQTPGTYFLRVGKIQSGNFVIADTIFDGKADFVLNYMRQQRCGWNPFSGDSCHVHDGYIVYHPTKTGQHIDVRGGWHDASDCLQYSTTTANAIYQMMFAYEQCPEQFGDEYQTDGTPGANGIPDIVDEIRWGLDWLDRMNPCPGEFYNQLADDRDHRGMHMPKDDPADYGYGVNNGRPVYFVTGEPQVQGQGRGVNITTGAASIAGKFCSCFALGSKVLAPFYPELAARIGAKAADAYALGVAKPGFCQTASVASVYIYEETNWVDDMELAAYEMANLTGDDEYLKKAAAYGRQEPTTPWMGADTARHYQWYPFMNIGHYQLAQKLEGKQKDEFIRFMRMGIEAVYQRAKGNEFLYGIPGIWCSNNLTTAMLTQCILYRQISGDRTYEEMEGALRDWLLGCNPWGVCMIVELPGATCYPTQPHSYIVNVMGGNTTGGLVDGPVYKGIFNSLLGIRTDGGINYEDYQTWVVYHDSTHDYSTNEPTMDGTACLTFPFAAYAGKH